MTESDVHEKMKKQASLTVVAILQNIRKNSTEAYNHETKLRQLTAQIWAEESEYKHAYTKHYDELRI